MMVCGWDDLIMEMLAGGACMSGMPAVSWGCSAAAAAGPVSQGSAALARGAWHGISRSPRPGGAP